MLTERLVSEGLKRFELAGRFSTRVGRGKRRPDGSQGRNSSVWDPQEDAQRPAVAGEE